MAVSTEGLADGTTLRAKTNVNTRAGPCTWYGIYGVLYTGQAVTYTGQTRSGSGYTWYSTNRGWIPAEFLTTGNVNTGGGGCRTRSYPLFKQCDGRWAWNRFKEQRYRMSTKSINNGTNILFFM
jgi:hypothetical protein